MRHLNTGELVDLAEGRLAPARAAHARDCAECAARADSVRETLRDVADVPVPEPSPLFWEHLAARIGDAIGGEPAPRAVGIWGELRTPAIVWTAGVVLAASIVAVAVWRGSQPAVQPGTQAALDAPAAELPAAGTNPDIWNEDIEGDEAWAIVRAVAEDAGWDETNAAGISARPESAEHVVPQLSTEERSELARLIEEELRRTGAWQGEG
jgi:hypothetical protein